MDSFYTDHRVVRAGLPPFVSEINTRTMMGKLSDEFIEDLLNSIEEPDSIEIPKEVKLKFEVCPTCDGRGTHVNPSIDHQGLTAEDFREDPDFAQAYFSGRYDQPCNECGGDRVVPVPDQDAPENQLYLARINRWIQLQAQWAMERAHERAMGY